MPMKLLLPGCVLFLAGIAAGAQTSIQTGTPDSTQTSTPARIETSLSARTDQPETATLISSSVLPNTSTATPDTPNPLPDAPSFQTDSSIQGQTPTTQTPTPQPASAEDGPHQTKRILGIIPNFRSVSSSTQLPPQSAREKITTSLQDGFDYSTLFLVGVQAGIAFSSKSTPEFHQGAPGYARYFWHIFADNADEDLLVEGLLPTVFHEDSRYYTLGHGGIVKRAGYAFSRTVITRTDAGTERFNFSEVVGAGAASGISSLYYPTHDRTWTKVGQRWLTSVLIDGGTFAFKEFWPNINDAFFHQKD